MDQPLPTPESEKEKLYSPAQPGAPVKDTAPTPPPSFSKDDILLKPRASSAPKVGERTPEELGKDIGTKLKARSALFGTPQPVAAKEPAKEKGGVSQIRTFRGDIEEAVQHKNVSMVTVVAAEQDRQAQEGPRPVEKKPLPILNIVLGVFSLLLVVGGIGIVGYVIYLKTPAGRVQVQTPETSLVFVEKSTRALVENSNKKSTLAALVDASKQNATLGTFVQVQLAPADNPTLPYTSEQFLTLLEAETEPAFIRSLSPTMLIGLHAFGNTYPFLIFKTTSYEQAFSGMLKWESSIRQTLSPFFPSTGIPLGAEFADSVIKNKDVRIVKNSKGETAFLYSFPDPHTLVITTNEDTFAEIVRRLGNSKSTGQ